MAITFPNWKIKEKVNVIPYYRVQYRMLNQDNMLVNNMQRKQQTIKNMGFRIMIHQSVTFLKHFALETPQAEPWTLQCFPLLLYALAWYFIEEHKACKTTCNAAGQPLKYDKSAVATFYYSLSKYVSWPWDPLLGAFPEYERRFGLSLEAFSRCRRVPGPKSRGDEGWLTRLPQGRKGRATKTIMKVNDYSKLRVAHGSKGNAGILSH